jgi:hypothetical protein
VPFTGHGGSSPPSDTNLFPMQYGVEASFDLHGSLRGVVSHVQPELGVEIRLASRVCGGDRLYMINEFVDECGDVGFSHPFLPWGVA